MIQIKDACGNPSGLPAAAAASRRDLGGSGENDVVGLDSDIKLIKSRLLQDSSKLEVISIVGMGGIGKTTLAWKVYNDPGFACHFDIRAWVTISQKYSPCHVLLLLLDSLKIPTKQMQKDNVEILGDKLFQFLSSRRFLIVIDDVWDIQIWDKMSRFFRDDGNKSRVLLTSWLSDVASHQLYGISRHQMRCLDENESWELLCKKVFGEEGCPLELESIGKEIAGGCRGLPLAIVVIGGVLSKDNQSEIWRDVAEKLKNSQVGEIKEQCLEILGLSYRHLPHHLRPCFLYMAVSSGDCEIPISKLISLWVAEGFLKPCTSKNMEEVAEDYLRDLTERNLILVCKRSCNGKMRTCSMHGLLRDFCVQNAHKENFLHVVNSGGYVTQEEPYQIPRRLSIRPDALQVNAIHDLRYVRSFLSSSKLRNCPSVLSLGFLYLRVLDVLVVHFEEFPDRIIEHVCLRYLALSCDGPLPPFISKLQYLETIVHHHCSFHTYPLLPPVMWNMPNLRHLYVKPGCYLSDPLGYRLPWNSATLEHLQTLVGIRNFRWTKGATKRIPNLKKLGVSYDVPSSVKWSEYQLESLFNLHQLETLKITIMYNDEGSPVSYAPPKLAFPQKLKKLTLSGCRLPWESMTNVGALPNLEVLKLRCHACIGETWELVEEEFCQLKFLLIDDTDLEHWRNNKAHFPRLQRLILRCCKQLKGIPSAIGEISTLERMELVGCHPSALASARQIQEEQLDQANEDLKFILKE